MRGVMTCYHNHNNTLYSTVQHSVVHLIRIMLTPCPLLRCDLLPTRIYSDYCALQLSGEELKIEDKDPLLVRIVEYGFLAFGFFSINIFTFSGENEDTFKMKRGKLTKFAK